MSIEAALRSFSSIPVWNGYAAERAMSSQVISWRSKTPSNSRCRVLTTFRAFSRSS
jgi:hypothetical protein